MIEKALWCRQTLHGQTRVELKDKWKGRRSFQVVGVFHSIVQLDFDIVDDN